MDMEHLLQVWLQEEQKQWKQFLGPPGGGDCDGKVEAGKKLSERIFAIAEDAVCYQENDILAGLRYLNDLASRQECRCDLCGDRNQFRRA